MLRRGGDHVFVLFCTYGTLFFQIVQKIGSTKAYKSVQKRTKKYKKDNVEKHKFKITENISLCLTMDNKNHSFWIKFEFLGVNKI